MFRVALVTGASRGLGKTLAEFLAGQGYNLVITARGSDTLSEVATRLAARYDTNVVALAGDIADAGHRRRLVAAAKTLGGLDLLINNAGTLGSTPRPNLADYSLYALEQVFSVNVVAQLGMVQAALPLLRESGGLVVNISSDAALGGYEGWGGYGASKAALDLISLTLANELRDENVGVVSVDPGDMRTKMQQDAFPGDDISDRPLPEETLPFWAWLFNQEPMAVSGERYQAQAEAWEVAA